MLPRDRQKRDLPSLLWMFGSQVIDKLVNSNLGCETSFPVSAASRPFTRLSKQTTIAAAEHKQEMSSINLNLSLKAWIWRSRGNNKRPVFVLFASSNSSYFPFAPSREKLYSNRLLGRKISHLLEQPCLGLEVWLCSKTASDNKTVSSQLISNKWSTNPEISSG